MATLTKKGTFNMVFPKGPEYSSISDFQFNNAYAGTFVLEEVSFDIVANWLCNSKEIQVLFDYEDENGISFSDYPVTKYAHKTKPGSTDLADELPGVPNDFYEQQKQLSSRLSPALVANWKFDEDDGWPRAASSLIFDAVNFEYHRGKWYAVKFRMEYPDAGPNVTRWSLHTLTRNKAELQIEYYDNVGDLQGLRSYTLTITETYYN
jgi:hypothetical protein